MKNILLSAFIGSDNLGDELIFQTIIEKINFSNSKLTVLSLNPIKTQNEVGANIICIKNSPINIFKNIVKNDTLLVGGGGIIQDSTSFLNLLYFLSQVVLAGMFKKQVILIFIGVGPISKSHSRLLLRLSLRYVSEAYVRDDKSADIIKKYSKKVKVTTTADIVFLRKSIREKNKKQITKKTKTIVVSVRPWFFHMPLVSAKLSYKIASRYRVLRSYENYKNNLAKIFNQLIINGYHIKYAPFFSYQDQGLYKDILSLLPEKSHKSIDIVDCTESGFVEAALYADAVLVTRFHAMVLCVINNIPFVPITYSLKTGSLVNSLGLTKYAVDIEHMEPELITEYVDSITRNKYAIKISMDSQYKLYKEKALRAVAQINKVL